MNELAATWADSMWKATWQGSLLILAMLVLSRLWKKMPPSLACALWTLISLKMVFTLFVRASIPLPVLPALPDAPAASYELVAVSHLPQPVVDSISWLVYLGALWVVGCTIRGLLLSASLIRLRRIVRRSQPCSHPALLEAAESLGIKRLPRLRVTNADIGVLMLGGFRPSILVSQSILDDCSPQELRLVLTHELAHLRRKDQWLGLIPQAAQILFFFNPLVWVACREFDLSREAACDQETLAKAPCSLDLYGRLVLKLAQPSRLADSLCHPRLSSPFLDLQRRLSMLTTQSQKPNLFRPILTGLVALALVPFTLVNAQAPPQKAKQEPAKTAPKKATVKQTKASQKTKKDQATIWSIVTDKNGVKKEYYVVEDKKGYKKWRRVYAKPQKKTGKSSKTKREEIRVKKAKVEDVKRKNTSTQATEMFVYPLKYVAANEVATQLASKYKNGTKIVADSRTNSVIVQVSENNRKAITDDIRAMDHALDLPTVKAFRLKRIDAAKAFETLRASSRTIEYLSLDPTTNSIIAKGDKESLAALGKEIEVLDK